MRVEFYFYFFNNILKYVDGREEILYFIFIFYFTPCHCPFLLPKLIYFPIEYGLFLVKKTVQVNWSFLFKKKKIDEVNDRQMQH